MDKIVQNIWPGMTMGREAHCPFVQGKEAPPTMAASVPMAWLSTQPSHVACSTLKVVSSNSLAIRVNPSPL
jgi:hypothetical protein